MGSWGPAVLGTLSTRPTVAWATRGPHCVRGCVGMLATGLVGQHGLCVCRRWGAAPVHAGLSATHPSCQWRTSRRGASSPRGYPGCRYDSPVNSCFFHYGVACKGPAVPFTLCGPLPASPSAGGVGTVLRICDSPGASCLPLSPPQGPREAPWSQAPRQGPSWWLPWKRGRQGLAGRSGGRYRAEGPFTAGRDLAASIWGWMCPVSPGSTFPNAWPKRRPEPRQASIPTHSTSNAGPRVGISTPTPSRGTGAVSQPRWGPHGPQQRRGPLCTGAERHRAAGRGRAVPGPADRAHAHWL